MSVWCSAICQILLAAALPRAIGFMESPLHSAADAPASSFRSPGRASNTQSITVDQDLTPLMRAVRDQEADTVNTLLRSSPDLKAKDQDGWTALTYAALNGNSSILKALLDKGADVSSRDNYGMTPLIHAALHGPASAAKLLLDKGADVNAKDDTGRTALTFAEQRKSKDMIKVLEQAGGIRPSAGAQAAASPGQDQSGNITRPIPLNRPMPNYTDKARNHKISGVVTMRILIGSDGSVKKMKAVTGLPDGLTYSAYRAAYQMRFKAATKDGRPVEFWVTIEVEFNTR